MDDQQHHKENVSLVLQAIQTELYKFQDENKQDFQQLKEEFKEDIKTALKEIKSEIYRNISTNTEKINTLEDKPMEVKARYWA